MKVTHALTVKHKDDAGVVREVDMVLLEDKSINLTFLTAWKEGEEPVCTPLRLTPIAVELLTEGLFQLAHHRDKWEAPKGEE